MVNKSYEEYEEKELEKAKKFDFNIILNIDYEIFMDVLKFFDNAKSDKIGAFSIQWKKFGAPQIVGGHDNTIFSKINYNCLDPIEKNKELFLRYYDTNSSDSFEFNIEKNNYEGEIYKGRKFEHTVKAAIRLKYMWDFYNFKYDKTNFKINYSSNILGFIILFYAHHVIQTMNGLIKEDKCVEYLKKLYDKEYSFNKIDKELEHYLDECCGVDVILTKGNEIVKTIQVKPTSFFGYSKKQDLIDDRKKFHYKNGKFIQTLCSKQTDDLFNEHGITFANDRKIEFMIYEDDRNSYKEYFLFNEENNSFLFDAKSLINENGQPLRNINSFKKIEIDSLF